MASSWIWQQPDWPHVRWESSVLEPLLAQARAERHDLLNRLLDAEPEGFTGGMTLRKAIGLTKVSRATAWRDLAELVEKHAIEPIGEGRSRAYRIHWPAAS